MNCYCAKSQIVGLITDVSSCMEECMPSGVRGISKCRYGAPVFLSFPHFYAADPYYLRSVEGLNPKKELHELYLALEPVSKEIYNIICIKTVKILIGEISEEKKKRK